MDGAESETAAVPIILQSQIQRDTSQARNITRGRAVDESVSIIKLEIRSSYPEVSTESM